MNIAVIGTGYVGLVTATCFAESGNQVTGIDTDPAKIATLQKNQLPIYEPGLLEMVQRNQHSGRLQLDPPSRGARCHPTRFARRIAEWLYRSLAKVPNAVPVFPN